MISINFKQYFTSSGGLKRRFGTVGLINVLFTNIILQILILNNYTSTSQATLISQIFNTIFGYCAYSKIVFSSDSIMKKRQIYRYLILMIFVWFLNWIGINLLNTLINSKNFAAILMIPFLALFSFLIQKNFVFKKS